MTSFDVSPTFVFSRHPAAFTPADYVAALPVIRELSFQTYQPEVYFAAALLASADALSKPRPPATACRPRNSSSTFLMQSFANTQPKKGASKKASDDDH